MATRRKAVRRSSRPTVGRSPKTFAPPIRTFKSPAGRTFTVERGVHWERYAGDPLWTDTFPIFYRGEPAGKLFRSLSYGTTAAGKPRWNATLSELRGPHLRDLPHGMGYDVAAFDTPEQATSAWATSADQVLDFRSVRLHRMMHGAAREVPAPVAPASQLSAGVAAALAGRAMTELLRGMSSAVGKLGERFGVRDARQAMQHWFGNEDVHTAVQAAARAYLMTPHGRKALARVTDHVSGAIRKAAGKVGYKDVGEAIIEALS